MKRTTEELRAAAVDAGWGSDPLANEILDALTELERADTSRPTAPTPPAPITEPPKRNAWPFWTAIAVATLSLSAATYYRALAVSTAEQLITVRSTSTEALDKKDRELSELRQKNYESLAATSIKLQEAINAAAQAATKNATAADSNQAAVTLYMDQFQSLLEEAKKLKAEAGRKDSRH